MKYLKSYKTFEANKPLEPAEWSWSKEYALPKEVQLNLWEMSMELTDLGHSINFEWWPEEIPNPSFRKTKYPNISITKQKPENSNYLEFVKWSNVEDYCERVKSYLQSEGFVVKFLVRSYLHDNVGYYEVERGSDTIETFQYKIEIIDPKIFTEVKESLIQKVDTFTEDKQWIEDVLIDLVDFDFKVYVRVFSIRDEHKGITIEIIGDKNLPDEITDYLLTIDSYLKERGYQGFNPYDYDNSYSASRYQVRVRGSLKGDEEPFSSELSKFCDDLDSYKIKFKEPIPFDTIKVSYFKPEKL